MKKIIEGKRNLLISIVLYCLSISIFLISQLSIVSGTFMSGSVFSYNYPLRVAMNCLAIVCAAIAAFGKTKKLILTVKILLSIFIIAFILIFGMENNAIRSRQGLSLCRLYHQSWQVQRGRACGRVGEVPHHRRGNEGGIQAYRHRPEG